MASILVVDDDDLIRKLVYKTLVRAGYDVVASANGQEAASIYRQEPADLFITDLFDGMHVHHRQYRIAFHIGIAQGDAARILDVIHVFQQAEHRHREEGAIRQRHLLSSTHGIFKVHKTLDTNVAILKIFPGMSKNLLTTILGIPELKALILETYGAGNAPTSPWILNALREAVSGGLHIVNVTQCPGGSVIMGRYKTSIALKKMHLIDGGDITTEAAITKLMYLLGSKVSAKAFKTIFETPLRGEMS